MGIDDIMKVVREEDFDVTLSGGDPLYQPEFVKELVGRIKAEGHTVWIYTGFTWEEIENEDTLRNAVNDAEAVVEGRFVESLRDTSLYFRGSANQRIIYL